MNTTYSPPGIAVTSLAILLCGCGVILVIGGMLMRMNGTLFFQSNDNLRPMRSPNGKFEAVLYRRTHKHGGGYTTDVSITRVGDKLPNSPGNVFVAEGEPAIYVNWTDSTHLMVIDQGESKVLHRAKLVNGVTILDH